MECAVNVRTVEWIVDALQRDSDQLLEAAIDNAAPLSWMGGAIDSRKDCASRLFIAIKGERVDGHDFVDAAMDSGALAAIVDNPDVAKRLKREGVDYLLVKNTQSTLRCWAEAYRRELGVAVVAVTGSAGKTTTKEYIRAVLKTRFRTTGNPGNFNSLIGVPLTVLETDLDSEYLVCEVGANQPGEIASLADLLQPDASVITNIGDAHVGMFGSEANIAHEKGQLVASLPSAGYAILPADDRYLDVLAGMTKAKVRTFGESDKADFSVSDIDVSTGVTKFSVNDESFSMDVLGEYHAINAAAAVAVGDSFGVEARRVRTALQSLRAMPGRGRIYDVAGVRVVDESYNASPASMRQSISMLAKQRAGRRIAILGDMKELGQYAEDKHDAIAAHLANSHIDMLIWVGEYGRRVAAKFAQAPNGTRVKRFDNVEDAETIVDELKAGDTVLVKASRSCQLDRIVAAIRERLDA